MFLISPSFQPSLHTCALTGVFLCALVPLPAVGSMEVLFCPGPASILGPRPQKALYLDLEGDFSFFSIPSSLLCDSKTYLVFSVLGPGWEFLVLLLQEQTSARALVQDSLQPSPRGAGVLPLPFQQQHRTFV